MGGRLNGGTVETVSALGATRRAALAPLLLLALVALSALSSASALAAAPPPPGFRLQASHGYRIQALAFDGRGEHPDELILFVSRKGSSVGYFLRAGVEVTETSITADLGALGSVDLHFVPSGRAKTERSACNPKPIEVDSGFYEGEFVFKGEEGYAEAQATRAPGEVRLVASLICGKSLSEGSGGRSPGARLTVHRRSRGTNLELVAMKNSPTRPTRLSATIAERHGPLAIERGVGSIAGAGAFDFDVAEQTASLAPPAPFSGTGHFTRASRRRPGRFFGSLKVDFPGRAGVPIAGPGAKGSLIRAVLNPSHPFRVNGL